MLYPLNLGFVFLPLSRAINFSILLHLLIAGSGMTYWTSRRGLHPAACAAAGCVLALSGPVLPHVYAGHLSNLCTIAWIPWAFAGLDDWWRNRERRGVLLASAAICFQILGGQVQYVFFFGVAAGLYGAAISIAEPGTRRRALPSLIACCIVAAALAAAQLIPSFLAAGETVRSGKLAFDFAAVFAFPPENLLTGIAPAFFGATNSSDPWYWGRCYPWEMSLFVGMSTVLAAAIATRDPLQRSAARWELLVAGLLLILAMGRHVPVYRVLYDFVPGFDRFRGMSKFTLPATLFILLAAARGIDAVLRQRVAVRRAGLATLLAGVAMGVVGLAVYAQPQLLAGAFRWLRAHPENDFPAAWYAAPNAVVDSARNAAMSLMLAAGIAVAFGVGLILIKWRSRLRWFVFVLIPAEVVACAGLQLASSSLVLTVPADVKRYITENPGDYRVLNLLRPNNGYLLGAPDMWGNDPLVLKRYAEFVAFTQKEPAGTARQDLFFRHLSPLLGLVRCRYVFDVSATETKVAEVPQVLPRALLLTDYRVRSSRDAIFAELEQPTFDPMRTVVLEREPSPRPGPSATGGTVRVLDESSDTLTLEVDTPAPAILLVTDLYSRDWRVRSLAGAAATSYAIVPANYILRAVALPAGHHRLQMEYTPSGLWLGAAVSGCAWLAVGIAALRFSRRRAAERTVPRPRPPSPVATDAPMTSPAPSPSDAADSSVAVADHVKPSATDRRSLGWGLLLVALTFVAYQPVWHAGYLWDDDILLTNNHAVKAADGLKAIWFSTELPDYFPVTSTAFWLQWRLWGEQPLGYHLVNVLLHAVGAVLCWRVLRKLGMPGAWVAAAIFALHPVNVESVAWISELKNTLAMFFYGVTLLAYLEFEENPRPRWYGLALGAFSLAMLSKTAMATFPVILLGFAWWRRGRIARRDIRRSLPFFAVAGLLAVLTIWFQYNRAIGSTVVRTDGFWSRLCGAGWAVWFYLGKALLPVHLAIVYPRWHIDASSPVAYVPALFAGVVILLCWHYRQRLGRVWLFAALYFIAMLLPILGFFNVGAMRYSLVADRWQYFAIIVPLAGVTALVARFLARKPAPRRALVPVVVGAILLVLGVATWRQARVYRDPLTLWHATLARNPECAIAHNEIGNDLLEKRQLDEAIVHFRRAFEVLPNYEVAHYNYGCALLEQGDIDAALREFRKAVQIEPGLVNAQYNLGTTLLQRGALDEALVHLRQAVQLEPSWAKSHHNLATALVQKNQLEEAAREYEMALTIDPLHARARMGLGGILLRLGHVDEAIVELQKAAASAPDNASIHNNLGEALLRRDRVAEALVQFQRALELQPGYNDAELNLGQALLSAGQVDAAIVRLQTALKGVPTNADAHNNLANAWLQKGQLDAAQKEYEQALALQPDHAKANNNLGLVLCQTGNIDGGIARFQKALLADPNYGNAHRNLGDALMEKGRVDEALGHYERAVVLEPRDTLALLGLGGVLQRRGQSAAAVDALEKALQLQPENPDALCRLAWILATSPSAGVRNGEKAVALARRAQRVAPADNAVVLRALAAATAETGNFNEAASLARRALQSDSASANAELVESLRGELKLYEAGKPCRD